MCMTRKPGATAAKPETATLKDAAAAAKAKAREAALNPSKKTLEKDGKELAKGKAARK